MDPNTLAEGGVLLLRLGAGLMQAHLDGKISKAELEGYLIRGETHADEATRRELEEGIAQLRRATP